MSDIQTIRNIGPKMEEHFRKAGFTSAEEIRAAGANESYRRIVAAGMRPHVMAFVALKSGLEGMRWSEVTAEEREALKAVHADILKSERPESEFEAFLDQIGFG